MVGLSIRDGNLGTSRPLRAALLRMGRASEVLLLDHREVGAGKEHALRGAMLAELQKKLPGAVEARRGEAVRLWSDVGGGWIFFLGSPNDHGELCVYLFSGFPPNGHGQLFPFSGKYHLFHIFVVDFPQKAMVFFPI